MKNLPIAEKKLILQYLYKVALADHKIADVEMKIIKEVANLLDIELNDNDDWLKDWNYSKGDKFTKLVDNDSELLGFITKWSTDIMNSDHIKHQNEQTMIFNLILTSLDNPEFPKAKLIPISELDEVQLQMLKKTPEICLKKASHWQKVKKDKPIKRVAASLSFIKDNKKEFVSAVNYELSTPGGSRCAEQNAIGMVIAQNPEIEKRAIKDIFVYGDGGLSNPCWPCGICSENLSKINVDNQLFLYVYPKGYQYKDGILPKNILKISFSDFLHR
jgi:cytidine deaminase